MTTALVKLVEIVGLVEMGETPFSVCEKSAAEANRTMARKNVFITKIKLCSFAATGRTGVYGQFGRKLALRARVPAKENLPNQALARFHAYTIFEKTTFGQQIK